jgi:hypothetical protein
MITALLTKPTTYNIKDFNVELLGSDVIPYLLKLFF